MSPRNIAGENKTLWQFWLGVLLLGAFLFVFRADHESLWMDEAFSIALSERSFPDIWQLSISDSHPPLYYFMLRVFRLVLGDSILVARLFSGLGAFALVLLGIGPVRRAGGNTTGFIYTLLATMMPIIVSYAQEVRMYTWAAFFVTGTGLYAYLAITGGRRSDWIKLCVFAVAATYSHLYGLFGVGFIGLFALAWILLKGRDRLPAFLLAMGIPALLFIPWAMVLAQQTARISSDFWIPEVTGDMVLLTLAFPFGYKFDAELNGYHAIALVALIALIGGLVVAVVRRKKLLLPALCLFSYIATLLAVVVISVLVRPILYPRYMLPLLGLLVVALAYAIAQFPKQITVIACSVLVLAQASLLPSIYLDRFNGPMREISAYLEKRMDADDVFVHLDEHTLHTFAVYVPDHTHVMYLPPESRVYSSLEVHGDKVRAVSDIDEITSITARVWLVMRFRGGNVRAYYEAAQALGLEPVPMYTDRFEVEQGEFFGVSRSWYAVVLQSLPIR